MFPSQSMKKRTPTALDSKGELRTFPLYANIGLSLRPVNLASSAYSPLFENQLDLDSPHARFHNQHLLIN